MQHEYTSCVEVSVGLNQSTIQNVDYSAIVQVDVKKERIINIERFQNNAEVEGKVFTII